MVVKQSTLKWFSHVERMDEDEMTRQVYESGIRVGVKGQPLVK